MGMLIAMSLHESTNEVAVSFVIICGVQAMHDQHI